MAGGKETPRQKMIGIMYLVLLALLALQVSSAVMEKFIFLDRSMITTVKEIEKSNNKIIANIATQVADRGNKPKEQQLMKDANLVKQHADDLEKYMEKIRDEFVVKNAGGWTDPKKKERPVSAKDTEAANQYFIGAKKNKEGYTLQKKLKGYIKELNVTLEKYGSDKRIVDFAVDAKDHPFFKDNKEQNKKDFAELNFGDSPVVAALATISQMESEIARAEQIVLNELAAQVGASDFKFDLPSAMFRAPSSTVAAGTDYEAEMFIAATASTIKPEMWWKHGGHAKDDKGNPIAVTEKDLAGAKKIEKLGEKGSGELKFRASGGGYDKEGKAKKTWTGYVKIPKPGGGDTIFVVDGQYIVAKPVIQVQSGAVSALYKDCGNLLNIQVPALGALYKPSFGVRGGTKIMGRKKGEVVVIPSSPNVSISVSSGGQSIGTEKFKVRLVPKPDIKVVLPNGKQANQKQGERAGAVRSLSVRAECPDATFASNLPKDARYYVSSWEVMLVRGKRPVNKRNVSGSSFNVSSLGQQRPGDRILIDVKSVVRKNFQNRTLPVSVGTVIINIPLTD